MTGIIFVSNAVAELWQRAKAHRHDVLRPATDIMLNLANVRPGYRVLDVAAGTGDQHMEDHTRGRNTYGARHGAYHNNWTYPLFWTSFFDLFDGHLLLPEIFCLSTFEAYPTSQDNNLKETLNPVKSGLGQ